MAAVESVAATVRLPGPPGLLPGRPDAIVDLQSAEGVTLVGGQWRYADARVEEIDFVEVGSPEDPLGPGTTPNRTYDVVRDGDWRELAPEETMSRLANGRVCFNFYAIEVTLPDRVGELDVAGATVVFEVVIDDYAEVRVNGELPFALGDTGGHVAAGFNAPNRVVLTRDAQPGETFRIEVFGINGPISASPRNYIWMRTATLDLYAPDHARTGEQLPLEVEGDLARDGQLERIATGFDLTDGPAWTPDGALLFSSPSANAIYRWAEGGVTVFRSKSGYTGADIGGYDLPGSGGLAFSPDGLLTICQHGNRRVLRVNPHGDTTVLADSIDGKSLSSPHDLVYRSDGTLYFTDPQLGGVYRVLDGEVSLVSGDLTSPTGLALSPHERWLYVADLDAVRRYDPYTGEGSVFAHADAVGGIKVDTDGNLYLCVPAGIGVLSPDGEDLGTVHLPEPPRNLAWGDADGRTLYITAPASVYRLRLEPRRER
jgi:gluconolactonase